MYTSNDLPPTAPRPADVEKGAAEHMEHYDDDLKAQGETPDGARFEVDAEALPPGYFKSTFFWGTMTGIGLGLFAGVAGFGYAAPILGVINADIGPVSTRPLRCLSIIR